MKKYLPTLILTLLIGSVAYASTYLPINQGGTGATSFTTNGIVSASTNSLTTYTGFTLSPTLLSATNASTTQFSASSNVYLPLTGLLKGNGLASALTIGTNGTDYTLITGNTCGATQHVVGVSASGVVTCSVDTVTSVSNSDGTLTISPTTGTVGASLALGHANTWTGQQTFSTNAPIFSTLNGLLQGNGASSVTAIGGTAGQYPYYNGSNTLAATSTLFLSTGGLIGIGQPSPTTKLDVKGSAMSECQTLTDGATITVDWSLGNCFSVTLGGSRTLAFSNVTAGQTIRIFFTQGGTGSYTLTYPGSVNWPGSAPTLSTAVGKWDVISFTTATSSATISGGGSIGY